MQQSAAGSHCTSISPAVCGPRKTGNGKRRTWNGGTALPSIRRWWPTARPPPLATPPNRSLRS